MPQSDHFQFSSSSSLTRSFQPVVRPSVVRPGPSPGSYRREPEGIESSATQDSGGGSNSLAKSSSAAASASAGAGAGAAPLSGTYDHAAEYDPYQSAARQMQVRQVRMRARRCRI